MLGIGQCEDRRVERRGAGIGEGGDREGDAGGAALPVGSEVAGLRRVDKQVAHLQRGRRFNQSEEADQPVFVEVIVRDGLDVDVKCRRIEVVEDDLSGSIRLQRTRCAALRPVRQGDSGRGVARPVDHDVGCFAEFLVRHETVRLICFHDVLASSWFADCFGSRPNIVSAPAPVNSSHASRPGTLLR